MAIEYVYLEGKDKKVTRVSKAVYEGNSHRFAGLRQLTNYNDPHPKKKKETKETS